MQQQVKPFYLKNSVIWAKVNSKIDIYHPEQKEILLFDDGIKWKN